MRVPTVLLEYIDIDEYDGLESIQCNYKKFIRKIIHENHIDSVFKSKILELNFFTIVFDKLVSEKISENDYTN